MLLTCKQALEQGLLILDDSKGKPAQIGYDLSVKEIRLMLAAGTIWTGKTEPPELSAPLETEIDPLTGKEVYFLEPGTYDLTFWEGCALPNDVTGRIIHRSSVNRNGGLICSAIFDPGFKTANIGTVLMTSFPIFIEKNSRLAQIYFEKHEPVENPYDGQWQEDKWRSRPDPQLN